MSQNEPIWTPSTATVEHAKLTHFMRWLNREEGSDIRDYPTLWRWSVDDPGRFWASIWRYFDVIASAESDTPLSDDPMPNAVWFKGARLNYAENQFAKMNPVGPVIYYQGEQGALVTFDKADILARAAALQVTLKSMGVEKGDRVVGFLPNIAEAIIGMLAVTGLGAIWSSCSPDFGGRSVLDRFSQIEPKVLLTVDGYRYNGREFDRRDVVRQLQDSLPTLEHLILIPQLTAEFGPIDGTKGRLWADATAQSDAEIEFAQVPFDHPLWVLYSSGTTGLPKPIVHGHGGVLLEHLKATTFHNDLGPEDRFLWFTSTGWMMWNYLVGGMLTGASIVLYDGSPGFPSLNRLWELVETLKITYFGLSPAFVQACDKGDITPNQQYDLSTLRGIGSTGAPLPETGFDWIYANVSDTLALESLSGGTDLCTAFIGGARTQPLYKGELQGASLGAAVEAYNPDGESVLNEVGELVITKPMPSMPIYFWNDPNKERYTGSYFEMFPGIWRHGDWISINNRGGCVIYGRSDSTINRRGIRMGTSEIYQAVESLDEILDSLIVDLEFIGRDSYMPLFVVLRDEVELNDDLKKRIAKKLRADISPRHVPDDVFQVEEIPYTLSGKKMEIPVRRILLGHDIEKAANRGAMRNPKSIETFIGLRDQFQQG